MQLARSTLTDLHSNEEKPDIILQQAVKLYLQRVRQFEPQIHAFVPEEQLEGRLAIEAERLLASSSAMADKPALWGMPVAIKDLLHVDGLPTCAGSALPPEVLTDKEGSLVRRLRDLGVLIAGKTVTEEFAYNGPMATRNPHNTEHTPGGSSAGSAAAVAAGLCPLAVGTQTLRSVIAPASFCGVTGFKPSYGRVPLDGVILLSPSFDTIGFFTQDLPSMEVAAAHLVPDWTPRRVDRKPVLGIPRGVYMELMSPEVKATFTAQIEHLEHLGYQVRYADMPWEDEFIYGDSMLRFIEGEMARGHASWFEHYAELYGPPVREAILRGKAIPEDELDGYRRKQWVLREELKSLMVKVGIDIWVSPAQGGTAPKVADNNTGWSGMPAIWGFAGCPTLSLPSASLEGLPLGFQCIGSFSEDEWLLAWAREVARDL
ncbi:amidase [Paenibacillus sp. IHBB 3054]|uniref:amidase n=1 Tax=Paenibacillus sp. IHBB 3054 TaxID=3425689 RepID=UPI003F671EBC